MTINPTLLLCLSALLTFVVTFALLWILRPMAKRLALLDKPGGRKQHAGDVPLIGGIAMIFGFLVGLLTLSTSLIVLRPYLLGLMILLVVGVLDDLHELTPRARLAAQVLAALLVMVWGQTLLNSIGHIGGGKAIHHMGWFAWPFTCIAIVGTINAMNMLDGVDGQASGISVIALAAMAWLAYHAALVPEMMILLLMTMATFAFACVNVPWTARYKAPVFMGDAGSMTLGFTLVYFCLHLSQAPTQAFTPAAILWLLIVPISDIIYVTCMRLIKGRSPLSADREHIHHLLLALGYSPRQTMLMTVLLGLIGASVAIIASLRQWNDNGLFWIFIAWLVFYCLIVARAWRRLR